MKAICTTWSLVQYLFVCLFLFLSLFLSLSLYLFVSFHSLSASLPTAYPPWLMFGVWIIWTLPGSWNQGRDGPDHQGIGAHQCDILCPAVHILWAEGSTFQIWAWRLSQATVLNSGECQDMLIEIQSRWSSIGAEDCPDVTEFIHCKHLNGDVLK